jgi:uncharacterized membrane protein (DUF2068 family)
MINKGRRSSAPQWDHRFLRAFSLLTDTSRAWQVNAGSPAHGDAKMYAAQGCIIGMNARLTINGALTTHSHPDRNRWLIAIGVLKLLKAVLFVSMGFGVIRLLHKDIADVLLRAVTALRFDPENRIVNVLLEKSALLSPHRLKEISFAIFLYAALDVIEGTGLVLEKVWAEYFTLILTGSFLPWELYEIIRHVTVLKIVLTLLNLAVFIYLAHVVNEKVRARQQPSEPVLMKKNSGS